MYATAQKAPVSASAAAKKKEASADKRYGLLKEVLYSAPYVPRNKEFPKSPATSPVHTMSSMASAKTVKLVEKDTVERAWAAHSILAAKATVESLKARYTALRRAMEELEKTDSKLFNAAKNESNPLRAREEDLVLVPPTLRIPTETPPAVEVIRQSS